MPTPPETVRTGTQPLAVAIRRSARARRLTLRMAVGTGEISLTVPPRTRDAEIRRFLATHEGWIAERRASLPEVILPAPGGTIRVLGETLSLARGTGRGPRQSGPVLAVPGEGGDFRRRLLAWVKEAARAAAVRHCDAYSEALGRSYSRITLRDPRTRWGSCTSAGSLMLSWRLALAPPEVFAYVCAHEVAHLVELNHSPAFWRQVERLDPEFDARRRWLHAHGGDLHRVRF